MWIYKLKKTSPKFLWVLVSQFFFLIVKISFVITYDVSSNKISEGCSCFFKLEKNKTQVCLMEGLSYKLSDCPSRLDGNLLFWKKTTFFFISLFLLEASNLWIITRCKRPLVFHCCQSDSQSGCCTFSRFQVIIMVQTLGGLGVDTGVTSLNLATA